jgi:HD-GYP domain-containing protein (c-di-GMP phosphodiesterase class II)
MQTQVYFSEIDSFYNSKILVYITDFSLREDINNLLVDRGFDNFRIFDDLSQFINSATKKKHDLIMLDLQSKLEGKEGYDLLEMVRKSDAEAAIISISKDPIKMRRHLELSVSHHFTLPCNSFDLLKAAKKAIGKKISHEIGMQFFDALFGMQMCTHKDLHGRTFDHVVRTTKIYGKFLLYLMLKGKIEITSWILKNCLMASMLHDIGKLLVMHGVLYKEGKLSQFEYEQVKRHPWNSITALLGGQDIDFFAKLDEPIVTVSGYKERNLGDQVQKWIFKIMDKDTSALVDVESFFADMISKPSIHSLNKDLLYIVFRHHDGLTQPYHTEEELKNFGKILMRDVTPDLSEDSTLDVLTNALSICDMYDALLDTKRDYRKSSYNEYFALFLLYGEMKSGKFFPHITEEFIKYIIENEKIDTDNLFYSFNNAELSYKAIANIFDVFNIKREQEWDFDTFISKYRKEFENYSLDKDSSGLHDLHKKWKTFYNQRRKDMLKKFEIELKKSKLLKKSIPKLSAEEKKIFNMLYNFYYSYSSPYKQKMLLEYLIENVIEPKLTKHIKGKLAKLIASDDIKNRRDIERHFIQNGYRRRNIFKVFKDYDEDILITELNDFIIRSDH